MVYTITFNPSIDYIIEIKDLNLGEINRSEKEFKYPGGKGINVSRVLKNLGVDNVALGFIGGFTGDYLKATLQDDGVKTDFIKVEGDTRINVKVKSGAETEINSNGPEIHKNHMELLHEKLEKLTENDYVVLSGNIQKSLPRDSFSKIHKRFLDRKAKFIIDTTGKALTYALTNKPFLIKPNVKELAEIFNTEINTKEEIIKYGKKLLRMGAENVIVSMAGEGAFLLSENHIYYANSPMGKAKNSVGAGDSLIAGFLAKYVVGCNKSEALRYGVACGSATAFANDLCNKVDVEALIDKVKVIKIT